MKFGFDAIVISVQERESKGNMYYKVNLDEDGEIVTLDCTPEAAKQIGQNRYKLFHFSGTYTRGEYENRVYTRIGVTDARLATEKG